MKRNETKFSRALLSALCAFALLLGMVPAASAAGSPVETNNRHLTTYGIAPEGVDRSYLYQNPSGGLTRVEYIPSNLSETDTDTIIVEDYSSDFQLLNSRTIPFELSIWGGFYAGSQYNFLLFGQGNQSHSDSVEVIRAVKYSKDWQRLGQASVSAVNTTWPFNSGNTDCAESGGYLYIHTCHTMYPSGDGITHQSNLTLTIRESDMAVTDKQCKIGFPGYVSHSNNQRIMVDSLGNILTADQGDGHPRSMVLYKFDGKAGTSSVDAIDSSYTNIAAAYAETFFGGEGQQTNSQLGGIAETSSGYLIAYAHGGENKSLTSPQQVHLGYIAKNNFINNTYSEGSNNRFQERVLTNYTDRSNDAGTPRLVPTSLSGGWIMWNQVKYDYDVWEYIPQQFSYAPYNADGSVGAVKTISGDSVALSDCQPILYNGKVVWYTTHNSAPVFYTLDASGVQSHPANGSGTSSTSGTPSTPSAPGTFSDVPASHWAYNDIKTCADQGIVTGVGNGKFDPEGTVTGTQFIVMLTRAFCADGLAGKTAASGQPWYTPNLTVADQTGITENLTVTDTPMSRYDMALAASNAVLNVDKTLYIQIAAMMYLIDPSYDLNQPYTYAKEAFADFDRIPSQYRSAVATCCLFKVLTGMSDGTFSGSQTMTRAQACAVIVRMMTLFNDKVLPQ